MKKQSVVWWRDVPVEEQDPTVVAHIMMHDGPEGNRIQTLSQMCYQMGLTATQAEIYWVDWETANF